MADGFRIASAYVEVEAETGEAEAQVSGFASRLKAGLGAAALAAGTAGAALLAKGFSDNMNIASANAKLSAQLGLTKADAAKAGEVSGAVYRDNWGGSIEEVNAAIKAVGDNLGSVAGTSKADLQGMTESALALAQTFDVDVKESTAAAGALIKNGLAKDSKEAFDILSAGFQGGIDKAGDFTDTLTEYSPQFAKLGISGKGALDLLSAGLKGGARDTDFIADAFKEFGLRAIDGSKTTSAAYKSLGLDAGAMAAAIAKGGPAAAAATQQTLQGLLSIKDPIAQNNAGLALFGTTWEDTVRKALPSLASAQGSIQGVDGATQRMSDTIGNTAQGRIETMKRGFEGWTQSMASSNGPLGLVSTGVLTFGGSALAAGAQVGQLVAGLAAVNGALVLEKVQLAASTAAKGVAAAATGVWTGAQWLLNAALTANPIGIVIVVIAALVAAIIIAYKKSDTFRAIVQAAMRGVVTAFQWVWDKAKALFSWLGGAWGAVKGFITGPIKNGADAAKGFIQSILVAYFITIPNKIKGFFGSAGSWLKDAGKKIIQGLIDGIQSAFGALQSKLNQVTSKIPDWKGPADKDAKLLRPAGKLIMGGLQEGIDSQLPSLRAQLGGVTASIAAAPTAQGAVSSSGGSGGNVTIGNITISGSFDMSSPAERRAAADAMVREMQEALVRYEGGRR